MECITWLMPKLSFSLSKYIHLSLTPSLFLSTCISLSLCLVWNFIFIKTSWNIDWNQKDLMCLFVCFLFHFGYKIIYLSLECAFVFLSLTNRGNIHIDGRFCNSMIWCSVFVSDSGFRILNKVYDDRDRNREKERMCAIAVAFAFACTLYDS